MDASALSGLPGRLRRRAGALAVDGGFRLLARLGRLDPRTRPQRHGLLVDRDVDYVGDGLEAHRLDVWRPAAPAGPRPVVLYLHGGGFRILSKETHYVMAIAFGRQGYVVFNANYRLAPEHPYPAALEDAAAAYAFVARHAGRYGGDPSRIVLAGESAGANLATALATAAALPRPEPFARAIFEEGPAPAALVAGCGVLQVSDPARLARRRAEGLPRLLQDRLDEVTEAYLGAADPHRPGGLELADPLVILERAEALARPFPPTFACAGTRDPLLDDTRRLGAALERLGVPCEVRIHPGEIHAFHALMWREKAREAWADIFAFLGRTRAAPTARAG